MERTTSGVVLPDLAFRIPAGAATLAGFREWVLSGEFPKLRQASYIQGELYIDFLSGEMLRIPTSAVATLAGFRDWV
jgi:hypothetical protein